MSVQCSHTLLLNYCGGMHQRVRQVRWDPTVSLVSGDDLRDLATPTEVESGQKSSSCTGCECQTGRRGRMVQAVVVVVVCLRKHRAASPDNDIPYSMISQEVALWSSESWMKVLLGACSGVALAD